ncbi:MAG: PspC domain-containing protein [Parcubacteria group bacterium]|nr:PspC domain-containing protein [Parcubacteria group bacterium]
MSESIKKLYRSDEDRIVAGVAGGLGEYFNIDPLFVRLIFIFLALVNGLGILFYIIFIFVIPKKGEKTLNAHETGERLKEFGHDVSEKAKEVAGSIEEQGVGFSKNRRKVIGLVILIIGLLALFNKAVPMSWFRWDLFWRIALIVIGFYLLIKSDKKDGFKGEDELTPEEIKEEIKEVEATEEEASKQQDDSDNNDNK